MTLTSCPSFQCEKCSSFFENVEIFTSWRAQSTESETRSCRLLSPAGIGVWSLLCWTLHKLTSCELSDWNPWKNKNVTHELLQNLWALIYWRSSGTRKKNQSTICNTFMCIKSSEKPMFHQLKILLNEGWNINMDPARIRGHLINPSLYIILSNSSGGWVKGLIDHDGDFPRQNSL